LSKNLFALFPASANSGFDILFLPAFINDFCAFLATVGLRVRIVCLSGGPLLFLSR